MNMTEQKDARKARDKSMQLKLTVSNAVWAKQVPVQTRAANHSQLMYTRLHELHWNVKSKYLHHLIWFYAYIRNMTPTKKKKKNGFVSYYQEQINKIPNEPHDYFASASI